MSAHEPSSSRVDTAAPMRSRARAQANIALVKYWGKSDPVLNTPAVGSISLTLDTLWSETSVEFDASLERDTFSLDGSENQRQLDRVSRCVDLLRERAGLETRVNVVSRNNFPTGAGLASSASGFAALVRAAAQALGLSLSARELSIVARRASGSAARSIFGGFVEMHAGNAEDGSDSFAESLQTAEHWPLNVVIAITDTAEKDMPSTVGMLASASTSPFYAAWLETHEADLAAARHAILARDFSQLAEVAERSCFKMHAVAMAARPSIFYWNPTTVACIAAVRALQRSGVPVLITIDAGPQLKAVCPPAAAGRIAATLEGVSGVVDVVVSGLGAGAEIA